MWPHTPQKLKSQGNRTVSKIHGNPPGRTGQEQSCGARWICDLGITHHQSWRALANGDRGKHGRLVVQEVGTSCDWSNHWSCDCFTHNHARLVVRLVIAAQKFWTWPSTLLRLILLVRSPTTATISGTLSPRFDSDSSIRNLVAGLVWLWLS